MPSTEIYILGQKYTIKGDEPEEYIQQLSRIIDEKIKEVCGKYPNITPMNALILTVFNMADELHKLRADQDSLAKDITDKADILSGLFD
jgi:cell division protein ZapA